MISQSDAERNVVLFDLDGTLLPMEYDAFAAVYFKGLCQVMPEIPAEELTRAVWAGTKSMARNDGKRTNREAFAEAFQESAGISYYENEERFLEYYRTKFQECVKMCRISDVSRKIIDTLRRKGYTTAVATNPIFPEIATRSRLRWIGMEPEEFPLVTHYENCSYAKPNLQYYTDVCRRLGVTPEQCVMIGNDVEEDGCAAKLGMRVILVTDCLLNRKQEPLDAYETCTLQEVWQWAESLAERKDG